MYAGLDHTDPQEVKKALKMTQEELDKASDENDSNCYWSTWEWIEEFYRWQQIPVEQRKAEYERLHALGEL